MKYPQPRGTVGKKKPGRAQSPQQRAQQRPAYQRSAPPHPSRRRPSPPPNQTPREELPPGPADPDAPPVVGVLELHPRGYGFLRNPARSYLSQPGDPYVSASLIQKHQLAEGLLIEGAIEAGRRGPGGPRLARIDLIEKQPADAYKLRRFDDLTPIDPHEQIILETGQQPLTTRVMDLLTPIGKGQRGLIVAPPRTGKTVLLQHIAQAVTQNHPEMVLILLLIDERPEEVTEFRRMIQEMGRGEVVASSSDLDSANHARTAELVVERAKRLAEQGRQVFVLLDSLTRLARAYNKNMGNGGRTMSGGVDVRALEVPKRLFGSARVFEEGGSLTVLGTALIETGSRMDDVIFQEFKGTGNMELVLDRKLAERRVFPAMDVAASGTRKEERILHPDVLSRVTVMRRGLVNLSPTQAMEGLVRKLGEQPTNAAFLLKLSPFVKT
jgi:transcription termination factor Rho